MLSNFTRNTNKITPISIRHNSSFIKQVLEQAKKDAEKDPNLKKAWKDVEKSQVHRQKRAKEQEQKLSEMKEHIGRWSEFSREKLSIFHKHLKSNIPTKIVGGEYVSNISQKIKEHSSVQKTKDILKKSSSQIGSVFEKADETISTTFSDDNKGKERHERYLREREHRRKLEEEKRAEEEKLKEGEEPSTEEKSSSSGEKPSTDTPDYDPNAPNATQMVVVDQPNNSWEQFGARLRDMPFLNSFYENPVLSRVFSETELAGSIREMKEIDSHFRLGDFIEEIEHVVAPKIIEWYLVGDDVALKEHCGDAAFAAVHAGIKARRDQKLELDSTILHNPREVELVGGKMAIDGNGESPSFIFTFKTQQINCLRRLSPKEGEDVICEGGVDDIREVHYAMAVRMNPKLSTNFDLEFPWQVQELAILGNLKSW